jgi:hypothetical protein
LVSAKRVRRRHLFLRPAGLHVERVAETKRVQRSAPRLEEGKHVMQVRQRAHTRPDVVVPARLREARIALLAPGSQRDDLGAALRPAGRAEGNGERKAHVVEV